LTLLNAATRRYQYIAQLLETGAVLADDQEQQMLAFFCTEEEEYYRAGKFINAEFNELKKGENRKIKPLDPGWIPREIVCSEISL
jgi:hypothetical protein